MYKINLSFCVFMPVFTIMSEVYLLKNFAYLPKPLLKNNCQGCLLQDLLF